MSSSVVNRRVFGTSNSLMEIIGLHCLWWLGHVSRSLVHFKRAVESWREGCSVQTMAWRRGIKRSASVSASVDASLLRVWGPRN